MPHATPRRDALRVVADAAALARTGAELVVSSARDAVAAHGRFTLALAGGSTPRQLYSLLATDAELRTTMPWRQTVFFWGDERLVAPDHPDSNYAMARAAMLDPAQVPAANIHRMKGEAGEAWSVAADYENELRAFFATGVADWPVFDLVLLGMGSDGHTASLFPESPALDEARRWVVASTAITPGPARVTLTVPAINRAARIAFLVAGPDKAATLRRVLRDRNDPRAHPARLIQPVAPGELVWIVDEAAASLL